MPFEAALMAMLVAVERQLMELDRREKKRSQDGKNGGVDL
jgi:hypothetical protein